MRLKNEVAKLSEVVANTTEPTATTSRATGASEERPPRKDVPHVAESSNVRRPRGGGDVESDSEPEETEVVVLEDSEMSVDGSSGDESRSRSSGSSYGSGHSRANRKRTAEDSPERESRPASRHPFPGTVSRRTGGCRLYLPIRDTVTRTTVEPVPMREEIARDRGDIGVEAVSKFGTDVVAGPSSAMADPFVVVNATLNVPVQLLPYPGVNDTAIENVRPIPIEGDRGVTASNSEQNIANAAATTMNEWGRHGYIVAEIHKIVATTEPPWGSQRVYEAAAMRFPEVDPTALRMTVLAVLMTQRQSIRDLTLAGARKGPRRDENGKIFIELDLVYANRYSDSYLALREGTHDDKSRPYYLPRVNS